jgi:Leucine-rich repeat (LRR) protein
LFLYSNKIIKIEFLQDCLDLEELNLADNCISRVENISALSKLKELNISGNQIEEFSKLNAVKSLKNLEKLILNDENFWPNKVCEIEGYFEYVLMLLPDLKVSILSIH